MANEEKSRDAFQPKKRYAAVGMQQGRVMLDDDFNENERIRLEEERRVNLDVIGPAGSPDDGFLIEPAPAPKSGVDFMIGDGTFYLGGLRLWNPSPMSFQLQDDWLQQTDADRPGPGDGRTDLVYVEAWQQPVSATEDTELYEVALGGPDTSTRMRTMWRVQLATGVKDADCPTAWATLKKQWEAAGLGTIDENGERIVDAQIVVDHFDGVAGDLCTPAIQGGYLGAENQTIRVQLTENKQFTWGFDNAAPLYQVDVSSDLKTVKLATDPRDQVHWPSAGQIVEILAPSARLPNLEKIADETGHLARVTKSFDPVTHQIEISPPLDPSFGTAWLGRTDHDKLHGTGFFMRVWDRGDDLTSDLAIDVGADKQLGNTGIKVSITGNALVPGDHWIISARPKTPTMFVPWELQTGRGVQGTRRFFAPLALIKWHPDGTFDLLHDCRPHFVPLTKQRGCCTYTVGDGGKFATIQSAVDAMSDEGGKICVLAGTYPENVVIDGKHNVIIEGCDTRSLVAPANTKAAFAITNSTNITIRDLAIKNLEGPGITAVDQGEVPGAEVSGLDLNHLVIEVRDDSAISLRHVSDISVTWNKIQADALAFEFRLLVNAGRAAAVFASGDRLVIDHNEIDSAKSTLYSRSPFGGIQIGGDSSGVDIRHNRVTGGAGNAITLGSVIYIPLIIFNKIADIGWRKAIDGGIFALPGHWIIITDQGCVGINWTPDPPKGGDGTPLFPVSEGNVDDIRIIDNDLIGAAFSGIAVARFFDEQSMQVISTSNMLIEGNRIHENLSVANSEIPLTMRDIAAFGAIALADGAYITIRNNVIERNGQSAVDPICGVFALSAEGISIENNRIVDNAPLAKDTSHAKAGLRGGIVLTHVTAPILPSELRILRKRQGYPAARIHDNIVSVPIGRALLVIGDGSMSISRNQLSSHGVVTPLFSLGGYYGKLAGTNFLPATFEERILGSAAGTKTAQPERKYFAYTKGTITGNNRFGTAGIFEPTKTSDVLGDALLQGLDSLGGATVAVVDLGVAPDLTAVQRLQGFKTAGNFINIAAESAVLRTFTASGKVLFADNQVTLELYGNDSQVYSSILLLSLDDVGMEDNQSEVISTSMPVIIEAIVIAATARMNGNRINQPAPSSFQARLSAVVAGQAAQATSNVATFCIGVYAAQSGWRSDINNIILAGFGDSPCTYADRLAQLWGTRVFAQLFKQ